MDKIIEKIKQYKYPLLMLLVGAALMLVPTGTSARQPETADIPIQELLSAADGVGEARILISENGVVVVCQGAEDPKVKLDIIRAISSYTGFGSDKITILKLVE